MDRHARGDRRFPYARSRCQLKSGIERALLDDIPELRGVEAINLPPYSELGWDQPGFVPVDLTGKDGGTTR